ncbi:MAG: HD-GYP domain-containing protein [Chloroflexi bacterium]|nr:MAG: HD-GYP domain-containing protein [Chloroflexota bacterium]
MNALAWPLRLYVGLVIAAGVPALVLGLAVFVAPLTPVDLATATALFALGWLAQRHPVHLGPKTKVTVDDAPFFAAALLAAGVVGYALRTELVDVAVALQLHRSPLSSWWLDHQRDLIQTAALYALGSLAAAVSHGAPWMLALFVAPVALILVSFRETLQLRSTTRDAIVNLADLIDARDAYTFGHSLRVAHYAEQLARRMQMGPTQIELVREAARLHDVGKIATEDRILQKPGRLTAAEMAEMHKHCDEGYRFLKRLPEFWEGAELVRLHHERYDANGYPRGIGGADLPWEASIISVADAWDAMTSDRPYRKALSRGEAIDELLRFRGTQWDPIVVDAFLAMLEEERRTVPAAAVPATAG